MTPRLVPFDGAENRRQIPTRRRHAEKVLAEKKLPVMASVPDLHHCTPVPDNVSSVLYLAEVAGLFSSLSVAFRVVFFFLPAPSLHVGAPKRLFLMFCS